MKVLLACEESQAVCIEMRKKGHEAYSCDILPCSGEYPEWHIQGDVLQVIDQGWDMMIAFPPCTHLAVSGAAWFEQKRKDGRQQEGIDFFMKLVNAPIDKIAIENPVGIMSKIYRKPDQVIQPYYFGDPHQKTTCLWLKNLPLLYHNAAPNLFDDVVTFVQPEFITAKSGKKYTHIHYIGSSGGRGGHLRSKTFPGIAAAMANQWGSL
jgi:hypothetical protein